MFIAYKAIIASASRLVIEIKAKTLERVVTLSAWFHSNLAIVLCRCRYTWMFSGWTMMVHEEMFTYILRLLCIYTNVKLEYSEWRQADQPLETSKKHLPMCLRSESMASYNYETDNVWASKLEEYYPYLVLDLTNCSAMDVNPTFLPPIDRRDVDGGSALVVNPSPCTSQSLYPPDGLSICITINGHKDIQPLPTNDREFVQWSGLVNSAGMPMRLP
ncbi:hypothetical protein C8Q75DRAFT_731589 [Abortiporus biennis]|nr:hypothetical protein C8Q75DRAFT_731589 [Abortiporus biennis]